MHGACSQFDIFRIANQVLYLLFYSHTARLYCVMFEYIFVFLSCFNTCKTFLSEKKLNKDSAEHCNAVLFHFLTRTHQKNTTQLKDNYKPPYH